MKRHLVSSLLAFLGVGCSIHYHSPETAQEYLIGINTAKVKTEHLASGRSLVRTKIEMPGIVIGFGRDNFGIGAGYYTKQRCYLVEEPFGTDSMEDKGWLDFIKALPHPNGQHHTLVYITGEALLGIRARFENHRKGVSVGMVNSLVTEVIAPDVALTIETVGDKNSNIDLFNSTITEGTQDENQMQTR